MVLKTQVVLFDDVDGGTADLTVQFALDGTSYEIDLSAANADQLRSALAPWIGHARRVTRKVNPRAAARTRGSATDVRKWAREQGHTISDRGRVSAEIRAAYEAAH